MGNVNNRLITYEQAQERCNAAQSKCIEHWFNSLNTNKGDFIQKSEFFADVMNRLSNMPPDLCHSLYNVFDPNQINCLVYEDFFCGIVIVINGTFNEHAVVTYRVIQEIRGKDKLVTAQSVANFCETVNPREGNDIKWQRRRVEQLLNVLPKPKENQGVDLDTFLEFCEANPTCPLCTWLNRTSTIIKQSFVNDQQLAVIDETFGSSESRNITQAQIIYDSISKVPLYILMNAYTNLSHIGEQGYVTRTQWMNEIGKFLRKHLAAALFNNFFDDDENDEIDFIPVLAAMMIVSNTQIEKRFVSALHIYERRCNTAGIYTYSELLKLLCNGVTIIGIEENVEADMGDDIIEPILASTKSSAMSLSFSSNTTSTFLEKSFDVNQRERTSLFIKFTVDIFSSVNSPFNLVDRSIELSELVKWFSKHNTAYISLLSSISTTPSTPTQIAITLEDERSIYKQLYSPFNEDNIYVNERYYIVNMEWWDKWTKYIQSDNDENEVVPQRPSSIDNTTILETDKQMLLSEIVENSNYVIIPEELWRQLYAWYGGGPAIPRRVIRTSDGELELELYPIHIDICLCQKDGSAGSVKDHILCSKASTVRHMKERACKFFHQDPSVCRIWCIDGDEEGDYLIRDENRTLEDLDFYEEQTVMIEEKVNEQWIRENNIGKKKFTQNVIHGLIGFANLGNTCYMNSCLQCLINIPLLVEYFQSGSYLFDINTESQFGSGGRLAEAFAQLISTVYNTDQLVVAPRKFKQALGQCSSKFAGYQQQDAQEALTKILEIIGDDLNRVAKKHYIYMRFCDQPSTAVANEWWRYYISREKSIITALFSGQTQYISQCIGCESQSIRYEVFNELELSVPPIEMKVLSLILSYSDGRLPIHCCLRVPADADINYVSQRLYNLDSALALQSKRLMMARVENSNVIEEFNNAYRVDQFQGVQYTAFILSSEQDILGYTTYKKWKEQKPQFWVEPGCEVEVVNDSYEFNEETISRKKGIIRRKVSSYMFEVQYEDKSCENVELSRIYDAEYLMPMPNEPIAAPINLSSTRLYPCLYKEVNKSNPNEHIIYNCQNNMTISLSLDLIQYREPTPRIIYVLQRKPRYNPDGFLSSHTPQLFGMPIPLHVYPDFVTGLELYQYLTKHFYRILNSPLQKSVFSSIYVNDDISLYDNSRSSTLQNIHPVITQYISGSRGNPMSIFNSSDATNENSTTFDDMSYDIDNSTLSEEKKEEYANRISKKYGFVLRFVDGKGISCSRCHWLKGCQGCYIYPNNQYVYHLNAVRKIALDWNPQLLNIHKNILLYENILTHKSVEDSNNINKSNVTLHELFETFTRTEVLYKDLCIECPYCKSVTNHYKTTQLYRMPPVLIIYLKRFQATKNRKQKINTRVEFPLKDLDLYDYIVHDIHEEEEADLTWWEYLGGKYKEDSMNISPKQCSTVNGISINHEESSNTDEYEDPSYTSTTRLLDNNDDDGYTFDPIDFNSLQVNYMNTIHEHREDTNENERDNDDDDNAMDKNNDDIDNMMNSNDDIPIPEDRSPCTKYDLYGVINHKGSLQEGHYTACVLASDNQWYFVNDSNYTSIPLDNVCTRNAYLLFYVRQDVETKSVKDLFKSSAKFDQIMNKTTETTEIPPNANPEKRTKKKNCCIH